VPLVTWLRQAELVLDQEMANVEVRRWLAEVANLRVHGEIGAAAAERLVEERQYLHPLPAPYRGAAAGT